MSLLSDGKVTLDCWLVCLLAFLVSGLIKVSLSLSLSEDGLVLSVDGAVKECPLAV